MQVESVDEYWRIFNEKVSDVKSLTERAQASPAENLECLKSLKENVTEIRSFSIVNAQVLPPYDARRSKEVRFLSSPGIDTCN